MNPDEVDGAFGSGSAIIDKPQTAAVEQAGLLAEATGLERSLECKTSETISRLASPRKESLKRKIPHDGFDEPEKPVKAQQELGYPHVSRPS